MCSAGKSTYTAGLGVPVLQFDEAYDYGINAMDYSAAWAWVLANLNAPVVAVDAWKLGHDPLLDIFRSICGFGAREVEVVVIYTTPHELLLGQREQGLRSNWEVPPEQDTLRTHAAVWGESLTKYIGAWLKPLAESGIPIRWVFRHCGHYGEHPDSSHALSLTAADPVVMLLEWIDAISGDPKYQTIELDGEVIRQGYTEPEKSWDRIQQWGLDWTGKSVADVGCFNGYFCFKAEQAGAREVVGYDRNAAAISVASCLGGLQTSRCPSCQGGQRVSCCHFRQREFPGESIDGNVDILMVLNVMHHIAPDAESEQGRKFLADVFSCSRNVIFEIERDAEGAVIAAAETAGFRLAHEAESHRKTASGMRRLLHLEGGR